MKILVTGGAGFIGSHIVDVLLAAGHEVQVLDNLSSGHRDNIPASVPLAEFDVRSDEAAAFVREQGFEVLVHEAAQIDVRASVANPAYDAHVNIAGLVNMVEAARQGGQLKQVLFASSGGAIYGEQESFPASESHPVRPESPYGVAKRCGELYLEWFERAYKIPFAALRYANVYGPRQDPHGEAGVVAIFASRLLDDKHCIIYGDGDQTRDYVFVADVAKANLRAIERGVSAAINVGTGHETTVNQIYQVLARHADCDKPATYEAARLGEQRRSVIDASRCEKMLGFRPQTALDEGLAQTFAFFRDQRQPGQREQA